MGTSDIALERVQALLKVDAGNGSLYDHTVRIVRSLAAEKPADALVQLETISRHLKLSTFRGAGAPDAAEEVVVDAEGKAKINAWCENSLQLVRPPSDPASAPAVLGMVQNFMEDAAMLEWAGVGFGKQESYMMAMSLRKLAVETPSIERLRLWGKMLGTGGDYYIAEGRLQMPRGAMKLSKALPGSPEDDVEPIGQGANTETYWVSAGGSAPWVKLPAARASHIIAARQCKALLSGDLSSPVLSTPWFPGKERHLLRAQIARISATCTLSVKGYYAPNEEEEEDQTNPMAPMKPKLREADEMPAFDHTELKTQAGWCHAAPALLSNGKASWPALDTLAEDFPKLSEEEVTQISEKYQPLIDAEPQKELLEGLEGDLAELAGEEGESPAWSIKVYGDQGLYTFGEGAKTYRVTAVKSLIWPGAMTAAQGTKYANIYVGYGLKCGSLVPQNKETGLPLAGTSAFFPLAPAEIMDEPKDELEEQEEPNPIQEEPPSDNEDVDPDPDA